MEQQTSFTNILVAIAAIIIILAGVKLSGEIIIPFLLSLFIAIICSPIIKQMTKRGIPLGIAIGLLLGLIILIFFFLAGMINAAITEFTASIPQYKTLLLTRLQSVAELAQRFNIPLDIHPNDIAQHFDPSNVMNWVSRLLLGFSSALSNIFIILLVVIFMLITMIHGQISLMIWLKLTMIPSNISTIWVHVMYNWMIRLGVI